MKILLVWPNRAGYGFKPIGLSLLSAILKREGHEVRLFDTTGFDLGEEKLTTTRTRIRIFKPVDTTGMDLEKKPLDIRREATDLLEEFRPDLVGVSALSDEVGVGVQVSDVVKEWNPAVPVVWGNKAATMAPDRVLDHPSVDYVCLGEGFEFLPDLAAAVAAGTDLTTLPNLSWRDDQGVTRRNRLRPFLDDLDQLPHVDWSLFDSRQFARPFDGDLYVGGDHMIYWGCPYSCTYCINQAYRELYAEAGGRYVRGYSVSRIVEELRGLVERWGVTFFKFYDEDFCLKPMAYFRSLSHAYADRVGAPFTIQANARNFSDEKIDLLRRMNCVAVSIGIESGDEHLRRDVLKRRETREDIVRTVHSLNEAGMRTVGFNMLGIPHETRATVLETIALNREADVTCSDTGFFYPLEGTELYDLAVSEGLFHPQDDRGYDDANPNLDLPGISTEELVALRERFVLYVKLPARFLPYIVRSEQHDEVGRRLTDELMRIYDSAVLMNDGRWDTRREQAMDIADLEAISGGRLAA